MERYQATPFMGSNNQIEQIANYFLTTLTKKIPQESLESKNEYLKRAIQYLGGSVSIVSEPNHYEEEGGSLIINPDSSFKIKLSPNTSPLRDNFTIAHELGHYILHYNKEIKLDTPIFFARYGTDMIEWQANRFAAAFLMPAAEFKKARDKFKDNSYLIAANFEVSQAAAEARMEYINAE